MNYVLDLIILGIFAVFIFIGVFRGFVRSAIHFLGAILAAFLSSIIGGAAARWIFDGFFRDAMVEKISTSIDSMGFDSVTAAAEKTLSALPDFLIRALEAAGVNVGSLTESLVLSKEKAAEALTDTLAPVFVSYLKVLAVLVLFLLFMILVRVIADLVSGVFRLPMLRPLDKTLGGVFGFLLALVSVWVVISALEVFVPMLDASSQNNMNQMLGQSFLVGLLVRGNPLSVMFA